MLEDSQEDGIFENITVQTTVTRQRKQRISDASLQGGETISFTDDEDAAFEPEEAIESSSDVEEVSAPKNTRPPLSRNTRSKLVQRDANESDSFAALKHRFAQVRQTEPIPVAPRSSDAL